MILKLLCLLLFISLVATVYASPTNRSEQRDELDDPTALSSFVGFRSGTNGYGAIGQLSFNRPDSHFGHNSFLQFKDDFETVHLRHFSIYKSSGTAYLLTLNGTTRVYYQSTELPLEPFKSFPFQRPFVSTLLCYMAQLGQTTSKYEIPFSQQRLSLPCIAFFAGK
ncbi:hypothetical protein [Vibrio sp. LB10LO1]|uniref:hypothetical protein n=1 Tax=Vibrio sp. LB10LO1 TaxID=2711207 RepID=UPI001F082BB3|nr:hypothetical protein [Vibrio sp. LB10LO1]